jgi:hypothetical protein
MASEPCCSSLAIAGSSAWSQIVQILASMTSASSLDDACFRESNNPGSRVSFWSACVRTQPKINIAAAKPAVRAALARGVAIGFPPPGPFPDLSLPLAGVGFSA